MESCGGDLELGELREDPNEVFPWIKLTPAATLNEGEPDGVGLPSLNTPHEEPVFRAEFRGPNPVFNKVVVHLISSLV